MHQRLSQVLGLLSILTMHLQGEQAVKLKVPDLSIIALEPKLANFHKEEENDWAVRTGDNVKIELEAGYRVSDAAPETLRLVGKRINPANTDATHNWFILDKKVNVPKSAQTAEGIRVLLASAESAKRYLRLIVTTPRKNYGLVLEPQTLGPEFQESFCNFKMLTKSDEAFSPTDITRISFEGMAMENALYLSELSLYLTGEAIGNLAVRTTATNGINLYEPNEEVRLIFSTSGPIPEGRKAFRYEIIDYWNAVAKNGDVPLDGKAKELEVTVGALPSGFYEVRAFGLNEQGVADPRSMIQATGSMPPGLFTFAVMPTSLAASEERMRRAGTGAFLGIHGTAPGTYGSMLQYIGAPWHISPAKWSEYEDEARPNRPDGRAAPWVTERLSRMVQRTDTFGIVNFMPNLDIPLWAASGEKAFPGWISWDDFLLFVRDRVRLNKQLQPHMKPRLYDATWEVDLSFVPGYRPINWNASNVVEVYRRVGKVVKAEDPDALMIGPCRSTVNGSLEWYQELAKAGLFETIDLLSIHPYHTPPPETARLDEKVRELMEALPKIAGRELPIISTEQGYPGVAGPVYKYREQSRELLRAALILLGEGVRVHNPYHAYDYLSDPGFGIFFNLDAKQPWGPKDIAPKPAVSALATFSSQLLSAKSIRSLRFLDEEVWGYAYEMEGRPHLALWTVDKGHTLDLIAGGVDLVERVDMMGVASKEEVQSGHVKLELGPEPIYVNGVDPSIYGRNSQGALAKQNRDFLQIYPGNTNRVTLLDKDERLVKVESWGSLLLTNGKQDSASLEIRAPGNALPTTEPAVLTIQGKGGERKEVRWIQVPPSIQLKKLARAEDGGSVFLVATLQNRGIQAAGFEIAVRGKAGYGAPIRGELAGQEEKSLKIPMELPGAGGDPAQALDADLRLTSQGREQIIKQKVFSLRAHSGKADDRWNTVRFQGPGSSGKTDRATAVFRYTPDRLEVTVEVQDDVMYQSKSGGGPLENADSLRIALDPEPEIEAGYNPVLGSFGKKITEFDLALTLQWARIVRSASPDPAKFPSGDLSPALFDLQISRDESSKLTRYVARVPAREIDLEKLTPGREIGVSILVNDVDGEGAPRKSIPLFDGSISGSQPERFGRLQLD